MTKDLVDKVISGLERKDGDAYHALLMLETKITGLKAKLEAALTAYDKAVIDGQNREKQLIAELQDVRRRLLERAEAAERSNAELRRALEKITTDAPLEGRVFGGNEKLPGAEEFYRGYNSGVRVQFDYTRKIARAALTTPLQQAQPDFFDLQNPEQYAPDMQRKAQPETCWRCHRDQENCHKHGCCCFYEDAGAQPSEQERMARAFEFLAQTGFVVGRGPAHMKPWLCGSPHKSWPACVSGEGETPLAAVENAIQSEQETK